MNNNFNIAPAPLLHFGKGALSALPSLIKTFGSKVLLVTGARSFISSSQGINLLQKFSNSGLHTVTHAVTKEPTPSDVDTAVSRNFDFAPDCVVAIGGGSALDAGKAISAMLPLKERVKDYLEGVGSKVHPGIKVPFIAIPTTSGTGSEATKNAVIAEPGESGYKRSLRHNNFVPNHAIVDPLLTLHCPPETTASSGMDAFTQLLESYVSTNANPVTDALALEGLRRVSASLLTCYRDGENAAARSDMALAAYLSGVTLANAGLGLVHGFASPIGGYFEVPHGVICSALMAPCNKLTVEKLRSHGDAAGALKKYAVVGKIFLKADNRSDDYYADFLLDFIASLTVEMKIPSLLDYGITRAHFQKIADSTDCKNNPASMDREELIAVLETLQ